MAKPSIALSELLEKGSDSDLLRDMIQHIVQRVMEMDVEHICAASYGERSPERQNSRNGYRERLWETRAAAIYTLLGTAKLNDLNPESYLRYVLERIADHPINQIEDILPWNLLAKMPELRIAA